jgi:hypothetical protein
MQKRKGKKIIKKERKQRKTASKGKNIITNN